MNGGRGGIRASLARAFGCDLRSLAGVRIALGLLLLAGLALRLPEFHEHYTDAGAWPIAAAREKAAWYESVYFFSGSAVFTGFLFGISALAALALTLGWYTRIATIVSWLLLLSLQTRNELMLNGGDVLLRLLLFWGMFLPLGARWSLDARRHPRTEGVIVSAGTVALLLQVAIVYIFNALYKTDASWRLNGSAIEETLRLETYTTGLGQALANIPGVMRFSTHFVWWLELLGPLLAFIPWRSTAFRLTAVALFMGFHMALFCTIRIGLFPLIGIAAWIPFIPGAFWDWLGRHKQAEPVIRTQHVALQAAQGMTLAMVMALNTRGFLLREEKTRAPSSLSKTARAIRLDQRWQLFAPPLKHEGWYVAVLECDDNEYDAFTGKEIDWLRPQSLAYWYPSVNWRKFLAGIRTGNASQAHWLCAWLRSEWLRTHPGSKVNRIRLHYLWERTAKRQSPPGNQLIYEDPKGPMTEQFRAISKPVDAPERSDN